PELGNRLVIKMGNWFAGEGERSRHQGIPTTDAPTIAGPRRPVLMPGVVSAQVILRCRGVAFWTRARIIVSVITLFLAGAILWRNAFNVGGGGRWLGG